MKAQTYTETQGHKPFNWLAALSAPIIKEETWWDLDRRANKWPTCACGNMCAVIPRNQSSIFGGPGMPIDEQLKKLGIQFANQIQAKRKKDALKTFHAIEKRSLELIRVINKPAAAKVAKKAQKLLNDLAQLGFSPAEVSALAQ